MKGLEQLAWLMDRSLSIPGTRIRLGLDSLLGLLPVGGDVLTGIVQVGLVLVALKRYQVPKEVATRMAANVLLDMAVGAIPLVGDVFDVAFKANTRNIKLLQQIQAEREGTKPIAAARTSRWFLAGIAAVLVLALVLVLVGFITIVRWLLTRPLF